MRSPAPRSSTAERSSPRPRAEHGRATMATSLQGPYGRRHPGHPLALVVTPANEQDRAQVAQLAEAVQDVTGENIAIVYVDQGYTGANPPRSTGLRLRS